MAGAFLPLLATVNNHGDLAVKLSSLKQAKDILLTVEPSRAAEILPYLVELQSSPETLVRKYLLEVVDEVGANAMEHLSILLPVLLTFLKDENPIISKQSIIIGTKFFSRILEELSFQFQQRGIVERWLEQLWTLMIKFSDAVLRIFFESGAIGQKLLAMKFLETCVLHFSLNPNDSERHPREIMARQGKGFNLSWISDGHPVLDPTSLASDANRYLGILLDMLRSHSNFTGSLTISAINSVAAIARKRPVYYKFVLNALLEFDPNFETIMASHTPSIHYSLRTAFLGFLRCTHPIVVESRERLLKVLRALSAGDAADQVIRQLDKIMRHNERVSRDQRMIKDDQLSNQLHVSGDVAKKRPAPSVNGDQNNRPDINPKRARFSPHDNTTASINDSGPDRENRTSPKPPVLGMELTPVEQMIAMIAALIAEGERGVDSLEVLVSNMHPDLLADIVITNMKHLPKNPPPLSGQDNLTLNRSGDDDSRDPVQAAVSNGFATSAHNLSFAVEMPVSASNMTSLPSSDISPSPNHSTDSKRDPRRDPRRLDPRRVVVPVDVLATTVVEENINPLQSHHAAQSDDANRSSSPPSPPLLQSSSQSISPTPKTETELNMSESPVTAADDDQPILEDEIQDLQAKEFMEFMPDTETNNASLLSPSFIGRGNDTFTQSPIDVAMLDEAYSPSSQETNQDPSDFSNVESSDVVLSDLTTFPPFIELDDEHQRNVRKEALERIINLYQSLQKTECKQTQMTLVARLFGQTNLDDVVGLVRKHIVSDYEQQKGHELAMHILYHLRSLVISDSLSSAASVYDDFLLGVAKSLLDVLPPSDKSFSRLLGDAPHIPDSILRLLEDICTENHSGIDGDRVTQGLGAVWSLILGRPLNRQACLDIALKCAVHPKDDVRVKAIRLVANKLYGNSHISENIERFTTDMFLSCVVPRSDNMLSQASASENRIAGQVESQETLISGSQASEPGISPKDGVNDSSVTLSEALSRISLFFALCIKKESLILLVFENYAHAPKAVKQAVHRHIPTLIRTLGSSCSELLNILSNPPVGSEQLVIQVLNVLCEGTMPSPELIANVKNLYKTRLKDATILIPILSAFSRDEVLPIFPQLVNLPLDKFQTALAHILMGSALTGPALTPVEVLVAIHDVSPESDGIPLKKITDACSACFEQRTVFTQSVLSKALNQMVERTPLPLLFMRTVIQAIDAFPKLVNCVMEILSKLVQRQIWRMPKLWVGFLKCISQTQPHSFSVLIQLPSPQLEGALNKYPNLRGPLTAFVNQSNANTSLPRSTLMVLGLASEEPINQSQPT